ncbi:MAG: T9SS type A sorting domain-containing protein, partial [Bacteroidota bacterium]|nr:T9SS type A sorting domain-containing protein [Bacteroidota bacterium]
LYVMGPTGYDLEGHVSALYNIVGGATYITSTLRIASLGDGSAVVQATIDQLVKEVIDFASAGGFLSVSNLNNDGQINVYPNPTSGSVTVSIPNNMNTNVDFYLYDITGKALMHKNINSNNSQIKLDDISSGVYFYIISDGKQKYSNKLYIIQ